MALEKSKAGRKPLKASERKRHIYTIRIDDETDLALKAQAKKEQTSITDIARKALKMYLEGKQWIKTL